MQSVWNTPQGCIRLCVSKQIRHPAWPRVQSLFPRTTYDSTQYLGHQQRLHILCRKEDGSPGDHKGQAADKCVPITITLRYPSVEQKADDLSDIGSL